MYSNKCQKTALNYKKIILIKGKKIFVPLITSVLFLSLSACQDEETIKFQTYIGEGQRLYEQQCANCHQKDGSGLQKLIPPLANSDYLKNKENPLACIIKYGMKGKIIVNRQDYNAQMPANESLSDRHLAQIITYITYKWTGAETRTKDEEVKKQLSLCQQATNN
jgi:cytochrome c551